MEAEKQPAEVEKQEEGDAPEAGEDKTKSKGQLKKEREKKKKQAQKAAKAAEEAAKASKAATVETAEAIKEQPKQQQEEVKETGKKAKKGDKKMNAAALMALKALEKKRQEEEEQERQRKIFEEQKRKQEEEERERKRLEQLEKERKRQQKRLKRIEDKKKGLYVSKRQKDKIQKLKVAKEQFEKMKNQDSDTSSDEEQKTEDANQEQAKAETGETKQDVKIDAVNTEETKPQPPKAQAEPVKQPPKKKFVKKKEKTLQQIYQEALKAKQQKEKQKQEATAAETVQNWEDLQQQNKPKEPVKAPNAGQPAAEPVKQEVKEQVKQQQKLVPLTAEEIKAKEKEQKKRKKREKQMQEQQAEKKEEPELQILKNHKQVFVVDKEHEFRSPICCILGHVDTGKTTLLDKIRNTHVQENEAGGITQQIGATFFPKNKLLEEVDKCKDFLKVDVNVPGLLIIDTPGHESFANLRSRGSSLCDIAILVIDLMHGLEQQTIESIGLLRDRGTPFVVALNKIDRTYDWKVEKDRPSYEALKAQHPQTISDYKNRLQGVITQLNQKGLNACMYWENNDPLDYVSLIPTSGITGEGLPDMLSILVQYSLSISSIKKRIKVSKSKFNCTVMEVKMVEGHGTTIDCILVDGKIKKDDQIVLLGFRGPIVTKVKALLTPHPMKEMRVKNEFLYHDEMIAANGVKISAPGLEQAVAGTPLLVANNDEDIDYAMDICNNQYENIKNKIKLSPLGVGVAASTLGSLEALLDYLNKQKIPVAYVSVGPVAKDDVFKATKSLLSENPEKRKKEYCCLLVFDVKVLPEAQKYAEDNNIRIFTADIIYHLTDHFNKYVKQVREERKEKEGKDAVFPCILKQVAIFRKNDPIVLGVDVEDGVLRVGTPLCVYSKDSDKARIGIVESIESNHKKIKEARKVTGSVAIQLGGDTKITAGKDFKADDKLVSILSRKSIDLLKEHFRDDVSKQEWGLVRDLKTFFKIA